MTELPAHVRVAIVGSGFAGLGMAIRLLQEGVRDFVVLERADDVGGTWRDNTYPGCMCDVPSNLYSFSFAQNPTWSRFFSPQQEIQDYLRSCARDFGVLPHVRFDAEVVGADWDVEQRRWRVETVRGSLTADVLVSGSGGLSEPSVPALPGLDRFRGAAFHSARWDHGHDLTGERVAVIGTGASAIQFVPEVAPQVGRLHVFQRTAPWVRPRANLRLTERQREVFRRLPVAQKAIRTGLYWLLEGLGAGFTVDRRLLKVFEAEARRHLRTQVRNPELRAKLTPDYAIGCKRILYSNDYYPALTRPNVELVTDPVREVRASSIVTADGTERAVDTIIFGTGFKTTDPPIAERVRGRGGRSLRDAWRDGMTAYVGTTVAGFPNFFMLVGPNTGLGHTSMVLMIESQVAYVMDALRHLDRSGAAAVDVRADVEAAYNRELQAKMGRTVWNSGGCTSWYLDEAGRNTTVWPMSTWRFRLRTRRFDPADYDVR